MGSSQMILVVGAILLLSLLTLSVHRSILNSTELSIEAESVLTAETIASEVMAEINSKSFDEACVSSTLAEADLPDSLTQPQSLGLEGEVYPAFDDVDDFNAYSRVVATPRLGNFNINVSVDYVNMNSPDIIVAAKTRTKKISVAVTSNTLPDTLKLYHYASY